MPESSCPEIAVTCTEAETLNRITDTVGSLLLADFLRIHGETIETIDATLMNLPVARCYLGNEFCERLLPDTRSLQACITGARFAFTLTTPLVSDSGLRRLHPLLELLPDGNEVIVNDWGVLHLLRRDFPRLTPVVGRLLCKMIKDPRLPTPEWARLYPSGAQSGAFRELLEDYGVKRMEVDVPPFASSTDFQTNGQQLSVHLLQGYTLKGRMCKIGSTHLPATEKFAPGHGCRKECLTYVEKTGRTQQTGHELATYQRGNTLFYRHNSAMTAAVLEAVNRGWIDRLIVKGDWDENHRTH
jgi:hypothetical protein